VVGRRSHLDSVRGGGRYDGPLGVAAGFEVVARASAPLAVLCLADEEGARYNTPTFGSRALVGRLDFAEVLARRDEAGISLGEAMAAAGVDPAGLARAPEWLGRLRGFLELHIDRRASSRTPATRSAWCRPSPRGRGSSLISMAAPITPAPPGATSAGTRCRPRPASSSTPRLSPNPPPASW
jgi:hypothetical protein